MSENEPAPQGVAPREGDGVGGTLARRVMTALTGWGLWLAVIGAAPGLTLWAWFARGPAAVLDNALSAGDRVAALSSGLASLVVIAGLYALSYARARARRDDAAPDFAAHARALHRVTWVLVLLPLTLIIAAESHITRRPWLVLSSIFALGVGGGALTYQLLARPQADALARWGRARAARLCGALALGSTGVTTLILIRLGLRRHHAMQSNTYDLGIFSNIVWNSSQGRLLACSFLDSGTHMSEHFDPIMVLLAPLAWIPAPLPETLIVFQIVWLCAGAWPLYSLATRALGRPVYGLWIVALYLLYPPLHANALWDMHSLTLATPLVFWLARALQRERGPALHAGLVVVLGLLLITREELALLTALYGAVVFFAAPQGDVARRRLYERRGLAVILSSLVYFVLVLLVFAPGAGISAHAGRYASVLQDAEGGVGLTTLLAAVLANPAYALSYALTSDKVAYALALSLPLLLLPLAAPRWIVPAALGVAFTALATSDPVSDLYFHYTTLLFPVLLVATPRGVRALARPGPRLAALGLEPARLRGALCLGALAASLAFTTSFGALSPVSQFRAGFKPIPDHVGPTVQSRRAWARRALTALPEDASVAVSGYIGPLAATRPRVYHYPRERYSREPTGDVDYLLVWTGELRKDARARFKTLETSGAYTRVAAAQGVVLLRRADRAVPPLRGPLP